MRRQAHTEYATKTIARAALLATESTTSGTAKAKNMVLQAILESSMSGETGTAEKQEAETDPRLDPNLTEAEAQAALAKRNHDRLQTGSWDRVRRLMGGLN
jgi:hypothetical protein